MFKRELRLRYILGLITGAAIMFVLVVFFSLYGK